MDFRIGIMNYCFSLSFSVCILIIAHFTNGIVLFLMNYIKFIYIFKKFGGNKMQYVTLCVGSWIVCFLLLFSLSACSVVSDIAVPELNQEKKSEIRDRSV